MGVVTDTRYHRCYWPRLNAPTELFAPGSKNIVVDGPGTPRNVIFPPDTQFPPYYPDALYPAELAWRSAFPGRAGIVNLPKAEADVYIAAYGKAAATLPPTATLHKTRKDCHFLIFKELISLPNAKPAYQDYVALLVPDEVASLVDGSKSVEQLQDAGVFAKLEQASDDPDAKYYSIVDGAPVDVTPHLDALADEASTLGILF